MIPSSKNNSNSSQQKEKDHLELKYQATIKELMQVNAFFTLTLEQEFSSYNRTDLALILEYCSDDLHTSQKFLRESSKTTVRSTLKKYMKGEIQPLPATKSENNESIIEKKNASAEVFIPNGPNHFEKLKNSHVFFVFDFLDPFSLIRAGLVCKLFSEVIIKPSLFKKFCLHLYKISPTLPQVTPFSYMVPLITEAPFGHFRTEVVEQAQIDLRPLVWAPDVKSYATPGIFFKKHKDFRNLFYNGPRVRLGGVYMMKERYIRTGVREGGANYDPFFEVEFYRYFRFFADGSAMSCLSVHKFNIEKLRRIFSLKQDQVNEEELSNKFHTVKSLLFGEYIVKESTVHVKLGVKTTLYELEIEIGGSSPGMFDQMKLLNHSMRILGNETSSQVPSQTVGEKMLKFVPIKEMLEDITGPLRNIAT